MELLLVRTRQVAAVRCLLRAGLTFDQLHDAVSVDRQRGEECATHARHLRARRAQRGESLARTVH